MKKILIPVDFSEYSNNAVKAASYIAKVKGMSVKLLHVIEEPSFPFLQNIKEGKFSNDLNEQYFSDMTSLTRDHLNRLAEDFRKDEILVEYDVVRTKVGVPREIIDQEANLIIMGSRKIEGAVDSWAGSVTEKVIRKSPIPVLTVSRIPMNFSINKILFASDFNEPEIATVIERMFDFAQIFKADIQFVKINTNDLAQEVSRENLKDQLQHFDLRGQDVILLTEKTKEEGILNYGHSIGADIIALCTHDRSAFINFFVGGLSEELALDSPVPVLTYNISKEINEKTPRAVLRDRITREKSERSERNRINSDRKKF